MDGWNSTDLKSLSALALSDGGELRLLDMAGNIVWAWILTIPASAAAGSDGDRPRLGYNLSSDALSPVTCTL